MVAVAETSLRCSVKNLYLSFLVWQGVRRQGLICSSPSIGGKSIARVKWPALGTTEPGSCAAAETSLRAAGYLLMRSTKSMGRTLCVSAGTAM